jgi:hypothetical protein
VNNKNGIKRMGAVLIFLAVFSGEISMGKGLEPIWKKYKFGAHHFSVESPSPFVVEDHRAETGQVVFQNSPQVGNTQIFIIITDHRGKRKLADIPDEVLSSLEKREGYAKFESRFKKTTCSKAPAILTKRTFIKNRNVSMEMKELDAVKGNRWFCVMVFHDSGNKALERMADQVIHSFKILN